MSQANQNIETPFIDAVKRNAGLTIALGIVVMLIGIIVMASPIVVGTSVAMIVGVMLVIAGIGQLIFAFKTSSGIFSILFAVLTVIIGGYMVSNPNVALGALTFILATYLIVSGLLEVMMSFQIRPADGWGWALFSGILSIVLGAMFWAQAPLSGALAIGILIGIRLLFSGLTLLMFGLAVRGAAKA